MKNLIQKLQNFYFIKDESKISFFKEICHVTSNENEFKTVNDLFIDNDNNDNSSDNFMLIVLFTCFIFQSLFLMQLLIKIKNNSKILKESVKVLIITSLIIKSSTQFITELMYFLKKRSLD